MREIVLDTETTGLDPAGGHRIVEIGGIELINHVPTRRSYQRYVNPQRAVPSEAFQVHGLSDRFLADKPTFADIADEFLAFLGEARLVIHNAAFDLGFLNAELQRLGRALLPADRAVDTVRLAREKFPGAPANLDALCRRFQIDLSDRNLHGALKDARLLADVYLQLLGGREPGLQLVSRLNRVSTAGAVERTPRLLAPTSEEEAAHRTFVQRLTRPIWLDFA